jgi:hypothetical protein
MKSLVSRIRAIHCCFLLIFILAGNTALPQRFIITFKDGTVKEAGRIREPDNSLRRKNASLVIDGKTVPFATIDKVENEFGVFKALKFRRRMVLARILQTGKINLFDGANLQRTGPAYYKKIRSFTRLHYCLQGDTVLRVLKKKDFSTLFDTAFANTYPGFEKIKKRYTRLHAVGVAKVSLACLFEVAIGVQSLGVLIGYTATTIGSIIYLQSGKQKRFSALAAMVRTYNSQPLQKTVQ